MRPPESRALTAVSANSACCAQRRAQRAEHVHPDLQAPLRTRGRCDEGSQGRSALRRGDGAPPRVVAHAAGTTPASALTRRGGEVHAGRRGRLHRRILRRHARRARLPVRSRESASTVRSPYYARAALQESSRARRRRNATVKDGVRTAGESALLSEDRDPAADFTARALGSRSPPSRDEPRARGCAHAHPTSGLRGSKQDDLRAARRTVAAARGGLRHRRPAPWLSSRRDVADDAGAAPRRRRRDDLPGPRATAQTRRRGARCAPRGNLPA